MTGEGDWSGKVSPVNDLDAERIAKSLHEHYGTEAGEVLQDLLFVSSDNAALIAILEKVREHLKRRMQ